MHLFYVFNLLIIILMKGFVSVVVKGGLVVLSMVTASFVLLLTSPVIKVAVSGTSEGKTLKMDNSLFWGRCLGIAGKYGFNFQIPSVYPEIVGINLTGKFRTALPQKA